MSNTDFITIIMSLLTIITTLIIGTLQLLKDTDNKRFIGSSIQDYETWDAYKYDRITKILWKLNFSLLTISTIIYYLIYARKSIDLNTLYSKQAFLFIIIVNASTIIILKLYQKLLAYMKIVEIIHKKLFEKVQMIQLIGFFELIVLVIVILLMIIYKTENSSDICMIMIIAISELSFLFFRISNQEAHYLNAHFVKSLALKMVDGTIHKEISEFQDFGETIRLKDSSNVYYYPKASIIYIRKEIDPSKVMDIIREQQSRIKKRRKKPRNLR